MKHIMQQLCNKLNGWNFTAYKLDPLSSKQEYLFDFYLTPDAIATLHGDDDFNIHLADPIEYYDNEKQKYISKCELNKILERALQQ